MIQQGRDLGGPAELTCDVVIVGSGAGGAPLAAELAMAGLEVVVLEKGAFVRAADMTQDWVSMFERMEGRRGIGSSRDLGVNLSYAETLGGSTVHYWACSFRPPPSRIERWNREFGLGLDYERDLVPLLDRVENNLSVHRTHDYLFNANNRLIRLGTQRMRELSGDERYRGENTPQAAKSCIGCGFREVGCAYNRKQSQLVSYLPIASRAGAKLITDCDVREILTSGGRATGVRGVVRAPRDSGSAGPTVTVNARQAVVAAGNGLTTPELLLRAGLTNANLGHNLVVNPNVFIFARYPLEMNLRHGPPEAWWVTGFVDVRRDSTGAYLDGGWHAIPDLRDTATAAALLGFKGDELRARMLEFPRLASAFSSIDDENHVENKVTLDDNGDWQVDYRLRGDDPAKARDYLRKICRIYLAAGFEEIFIPTTGRTIQRAGTYPETAGRIDDVVDTIAAEPSDLTISGAHLLCTARRSATPGNGVCDPHGETYELPGLYVAGSAALPTSVGVDPSITMITISTLLARQLLAARGKQLVELGWRRTRKNHAQIVSGPPAALGYDVEQRRLASGQEVAVG
jgi:hypothetical protein